MRRVASVENGWSFYADCIDTPSLTSSIRANLFSWSFDHMYAEQVPIINRRAKKLVSAEALSRAQRNNLPPQGVDYPPEKPVCLRGHTPAMIGPSKFRMKPQRSVRGARGAKNIETGKFKKPGVLEGLSVSPWVVEEELERAQRVRSHKAAISKVGLIAGLRSISGSHHE